MKRLAIIAGLWLFLVTHPVSAGLNGKQPCREETLGSTSLPDPTEHEVQIKLALARRKRIERDFVQASETLASILDSPVGEEFKRAALLELAVTAQDSGRPAQAQQILSQYVSLYPDDPSTSEVLLRQGVLYREMGATEMALSKFYAVMTTILNLKLDTAGDYQKMVLDAQTEIANTYYGESKYAEAEELFVRLLKLSVAKLNRPEIELKLLRCASQLKQYPDVVTRAQGYLGRYGDDPEARFLLAEALQQLGRKPEAINQVLRLLESSASGEWKCRAGNQFANQLYAQRDYAGARLVYEALAQAETSANWQIPVLYQLGLTYERLGQTEQATAAYARVLDRRKELGQTPDLELKTVLDMASWRKNYLAWQTEAVQANQALQHPPTELTR
ncbi:MAG TPA: tetratricopeptide repeat protein [Verrucomicrobiae bacterium]|nr:tetratricopeptide repeat protein [Verrucomicrobiae bacterium]